VRPPAADAVPHPVATHLREVALTPLRGDALASAADQPVAPTEGARAYRPQGSPRAGLQTGAQATHDRLHVIGVTWAPGALKATDRVEYRVKDGATWGDWTAMVAEDDHAPDPGTPEARNQRAGTDPYVVTADAVEARVLTDRSSAPAGVQLDLVDPSVSAADDAGSGSGAGSAQAAGTKPTILSRAQWGADESLRTGAPSYGTIKAGFVHHTVNANSYTSGQVPAIIRGIYAFHTQSRGWSDIGYNFLVDRFGRTWEGRAGGVDQPVIGAHTGGFNSQLFGAAAIGTFDTTTPPAAMMSAYDKLFAWKLGLAHVDPVAKVTLTGMTRSVYTVSGHRDADGEPNNTACPGNALYAKLGGIRTAARNLMGANFFNPAQDTTQWDYAQPGLTITAKPNRPTMRWTLQVRSACRPDVLATAAGTAIAPAGIVASWNGKLTSGTWAPPGDYLVSVSGSAGSGTINSAPPYTVRVHVNDAPGAPPGYCPERIGGSDRYDTSVRVAQASAPGAKVVVLASGTDAGMADALVAAPLARKRSAALLLTGPDRLPDSVYADIRARRATSATIVGGTGVISSTVESQLRTLGVTSIDRVAGRNRYDTAAGVAVRMGSAPDVLVASGRSDAMADGLVLSGPGAALARPVLLVAGDRVPRETAWALARVGAARSVVAGGTGVVPEAVVRQLPSPRRVAGSDRYGTGVAVAQWARSLMPAKEVLLSSGQPAALVDTLSGGQLGRITLYATATTMPASTAGWLDAAPGLEGVTVLGGTAAISDLVAGRAQRAVLQ
jgi:putative cell wall-binding protein